MGLPQCRDRRRKWRNWLGKKEEEANRLLDPALGSVWFVFDFFFFSLCFCFS